jgi:hypothetical protein
MKPNYPFKWAEVPADEVMQVKRKPGEFIRSEPGGVWMPKHFEEVRGAAIQGDKIVRIFTLWALVLLGQFFK